MKRRISNSLLLLLILIFTACENKQSRTNGDPELAEAEVSLDQVIANASFTDFDGNAVSLSDYEGKIVLIDFWETWCGPCLQVFPAMDSLRTEYPNDFAVIAVNTGWTDSKEEATSFIAENDYDFVFARDNEDVLASLGVPGIPFKVFVAPNGDIIKAELGSYGTEGDYKYAKELIQEYTK